MHPQGNPGGAAAAHGHPNIGQTLDDKYEIVRLLGKGGMAFIYEARHLRLQQRVAIKMLAPEFARDAEIVSRFEREARALARLSTKHVARVMDVDSTPDGIPYIVMEFLEGRDLEAELLARGRLPIGEAADCVLQACAGMVAAHGMGIVHRDLKPGNLFLANERDGNERVVKVIDFGISKMASDAKRLTIDGTVIGTVLYMSPEQLRAQNVDDRADIWALGVILFELVAGRAPWEGNTHQIGMSIISEDAPDLRTFAPVPEAFANVVRTMLQRDPAHRYNTVRDAIGALGPFATPGSLGAAAAEQVASQAGLRARSVQAPPAPMMLRTLPMGNRPTALDAAAAMARASRPPPSVPTAPPSSPSLGPASVHSAGGSKFMLIFTIVVVLLGVTGVVLIVVAMTHRRAAGDHRPPRPAPTATTAPSR